MEEARLEETETGLVPRGDGWFIANVAELSWDRSPVHGTWCVFNDPDQPSQQLGIGVHVLEPGQPNGRYHAELRSQEGFLVLDGECIVLVEGEERRMRKWDYFHCPPGTVHIAVGAGEGRCAILMVGVRQEDDPIHYPVSELAAKYGASAPQDTDAPEVAYSDVPRELEAVRAPWPPAEPG
jgi:uncharacterized cupin superfamily protein